MKIVDLSLPLYTGMPVYPGDPEASIEPVHTLAREGWVMRRLEINSHDGTHVNVPAHMIPGGRSLDDYALDDFCGRARLYRAGTAMKFRAWLSVRRPHHRCCVGEENCRVASALRRPRQ